MVLIKKLILGALILNIFTADFKLQAKDAEIAVSIRGRNCFAENALLVGSSLALFYLSKLCVEAFVQLYKDHKALNILKKDLYKAEKELNILIEDLKSDYNVLKNKLESQQELKILI